MTCNSNTTLTAFYWLYCFNIVSLCHRCVYIMSYIIQLYIALSSVHYWCAFISICDAFTHSNSLCYNIWWQESDSTVCDEYVFALVTGRAWLGVNDCDILRLSRFYNITYHNCENNHDYIILAIFDEKSMQQVMIDKVKCVL